MFVLTSQAGNSDVLDDFVHLKEENRSLPRRDGSHLASVDRRNAKLQEKCQFSERGRKFFFLKSVFPVQCLYTLSILCVHDCTLTRADHYLNDKCENCSDQEIQL